MDLYFYDYKLAIEVDELVHCDKNINHKIERQKAIEKELACKSIRTNPDENDYNIFKAINKIHWHNKKPHKRFFTDKISKRLLEFESNNSLKYVVKKILSLL